MTNPEPAHSGEDTSESFDLKHYFLLFWNHKILIVGLGLLFAIPTAKMMLELPSTYESTVSMRIEPSQTAGITDMIQALSMNSRSQTYFGTQLQIMRSQQLARRVIDNLNLMEHREFVPQVTNEGGENSPPPVRNDELINNVLGRFESRLTVSAIPSTSIVRISFTATDPKLAADIANEVAYAYIQQDLEQRLDATQQAGSMLSDRAESLSQALKESEERLQAFLEQEQLVDIGGVTTLKTQEVDDANRQAIEARLRRTEIENLRNQIREIENASIDQLLTFPAILNNANIQQTLNTLDQIDRQFAELSNRYGENHPQMVALSAQRSDVETNLDAQIQQLISTIDSQYRAAVDSERNALARLEESKSELQEINSKGFELQQLQREAETNRQLYEMFFTRIRQTQETDELQSSNATIIDPAVPAIYPTGPERKKNVLIALFAGLMLGGGLVLGRDILDSSITNYSQIEKRLGQTVLGVVPFIKNKKRKKDERLHFTSKLGPEYKGFAESFRTIRTSFTLATMDKPAKVICVTSSMPGEGKSTIAINLALVLAKMGRQVMLIDADLRRPSIAKGLGIQAGAPGLSNYLSGANTLKECVHLLENVEFKILPAGDLVSDPLQLLSSSKFKMMLRGIGEQCDHIIIDTPPTSAVSDSLILANISDAVIFVIKAGAVPARIIKNQLARLKRAKSSVIGVILNQMLVEKNSEYGGYYDSYGYTVDDEKTS